MQPALQIPQPDEADEAPSTRVVRRREDSEEWIEVAVILRELEYVRGLLAESPPMREVCDTIARVAPYKTTVLIEGESGTGKELVARAIHALGPSPRGPYIVCNCANLVESLAESQLFGHVRGAFTDARDDALGYFRSAHGGTLFLDEIGELPMRLQPKLLRAVELQEIQPVGSTKVHQADVRLVAATNRDLGAMVKSGHFREDLYYRLNATAVRLAPLRERREAIVGFAVHFIHHFNQVFQKKVTHVSERALSALTKYEWPGNVREFGHVIESAMLVAHGDRIDVTDLPERVRAAVEPIHAAPLLLFSEEVAPAAPEGEAPSLDDVTRTALARTLAGTGGNRRQAARMLGISRSRLYRLLERYGLDAIGREAGNGRVGRLPLRLNGAVAHARRSHPLSV
jgi:DNA-binding NtrC family response regulator